MLFAIPVPRCVQLKPFFSEGDLSIYVSPIPSALSQCECAFACMDHWTKFRILTCKCLTLGAPSSNTLIPPWSSYPWLPSALSIFSISSFSLSLSPSNENGFTCSFKCKNGYSVHSASCRSESTRFFHFVKSVTCFQKSCMWDLLASIASKNC